VSLNGQMHQSPRQNLFMFIYRTVQTYLDAHHFDGAVRRNMAGLSLYPCLLNQFDVLACAS